MTVDLRRPSVCRLRPKGDLVDTVTSYLGALSQLGRLTA